MLSREIRVSDHLTYHIPDLDNFAHEYVGELVECMRAAHKMLQEKQWQVRTKVSDEPPLYKVGDWVWMANYRR